jgi:hypothetical protein
MKPVVKLSDEQIDRQCVEIRQRLRTLGNHQQEMSKQQVITLAEKIIEDMMALMELMERKQ